MSRKILNISLLLSLLLVLSVLLLYRGTNWPLGLQGIEALGALVLLLAINIILFLQSKKVSTTNTYADKSITLGLFAGLLWTAEISMNNILLPELPARDILDDIFWAAIAFIIIIGGIRYAYQAKKLSIGIEVGFWSGLASGAIACLTGLVFIVFGMQFLLHDPLNIAEWSARGATSGTPNMAVYLAYETLTGTLLHLIVLGAVMGTILGIIGGALGRVGNFIVKGSSRQ